MTMLKKSLALILLCLFALALPTGAQAGGYHPMLVGAAQAGDPAAQAMLGGLMEQQGNPQCVYWLQKSAAQNYGYAQSYLAVVYSEGKVVPKNMRLAMQLAQKACNNVNGGARTRKELNNWRRSGRSEACMFYNMIRTGQIR